MKYKLVLLVSFFILTNIVFGQTGTIKVAKPKPTPIKDSIVPFKRSLYISADFGTNYTFKGNNKVGFDGGVYLFMKSKEYCFGVGFQYDYENIYYKLSAYNKLTQQAEISYSNSQNQSEYIKIPIIYQTDYITGSGGGVFFMEITPKYLLKNKNEYNRLNTNDFNQYNLAWTIGIGHKIYKQIWYKLEYSKDFFQNLKDIHIYNAKGEVIGKQKSQTNLLSLSICYVFK